MSFYSFGVCVGGSGGGDTAAMANVDWLPNWAHFFLVG